LSDSVTEDRKTFSAKWKYNALNYLYMVGIVCQHGTNMGSHVPKWL